MNRNLLSLFFVGLDVAKAKVDVALLSANKCKSKTIANSAAGFAELLQWLSKLGVSGALFGMEATGSYHEALALFLVEHGQRVFVINPACIKRYAEASMVRGKTDAADARVIAHFVQAQHATLDAWQPAPVEVRRLRELARRLESLKALRQQEANRGPLAHEAEVIASLNTVLALLDVQIAQIERAIHDHIDGHPRLREDRDLLDSIVGLGQITIPILLAEVPWDNLHHAKQAGAYGGLTACPHQSGDSVKGKSRISKVGSSRLRRALYFPAIVAKQHNPILRAFYERLIANGKSKMTAICAVMRKLLSIAFAVLRSRKPFDPNYLNKLPKTA